MEQQKQEIDQQDTDTKLNFQTLISSGVQYGTKTSEWNPKMAPFIYGSYTRGRKENIYIINLDKTIKLYNAAKEAVKTCISSGKDVLFVCTKPQSKGAAAVYGLQCDSPYVENKWQAGTLTNFAVAKKTIQQMTKLETYINDYDEGKSNVFNKKEVSKFRSELEKLNKRLGGIRNMKKLPGLLFVIDPVTEEIAVQEANKLGIPVIALCDTNANPELVQHVIPGNDDGVKTIDLFLRKMSLVVKQEKEVYAELFKSIPDPVEEELPQEAPKENKKREKSKKEEKKIHISTKKKEITLDLGAEPI